MSRVATAPTRTRLMDAAQELILDYGYSGTSLDRVIERAGVTKGTFFYHFKSKAALAHALVQRFADDDGALLEEWLAKAEAAHEDPLEQVLFFVQLFEEMAAGLTEPYPGCLFASYVMEKGLFDEEVLAIARRAFRRWRVEFGAKLRAAMQRYPTRIDVDPESLAEGLNTIAEGAFILSNTYGQPEVIAEQVAHYRRYIELLFGRA